MDEVDFDTSIDTNAVQADMPQSQRGAEDAVAAEGPGHHSEDFNLQAFDENVEPAHESQRIGDPEMINEGATAAADPTPSVQADKMVGKPSAEPSINPPYSEPPRGAAMITATPDVGRSRTQNTSPAIVHVLLVVFNPSFDER